jgi:hypothetical protein
MVPPPIIRKFPQLVCGFLGFVFLIAECPAAEPYEALTWDSDIQFPAGGYRAGKPVDLKGDFKVVASAGAFLDGIETKSSASGQHWTATGAFFRNVKIAGELGVSLEATDSIFEGCQFSKGGGWFVDWWGSRWRFTNCVIARSLFPPSLSVSNYSVVAKDCTFFGVKLPTIDLKKNYDYFQGENLRMENCRFVQCTIPLTFLATTVNCVFEKCVFPSERVAWPPQMPPVKVSAFYDGGMAPPAITQGPVSVVFAPLPAGTVAGSQLKFTQTGGAVKSETIPEPDHFAQIATLRKKKSSEVVSGK